MYKPFFLQRLLRSAPPRPGAPSRAAVRSARRVASNCHELLSQRGEVSGAFIAREALTAYQSLDEQALDVFFSFLVKEFSLDPEAVGRSADAYRREPSPGNLLGLQQAVDAPRQELFRRLNMAAGAIAVLLEMRRRLLRGLVEHPHWIGIETDLAHLFRSWFNRGFLVLQRIDWRTSALVLEKLIQYEAVHQIQGWHDLRRRLQADRRCYAFFHPTLPDEPVIFIEVALTRGMSATPGNPNPARPSVRLLSALRQAGRRAAGGGGPVPPRQRRAPGAPQLAGRHLGDGHAPLGGAHGELRLPSRRPGTQPRSLRQGTPHHRLAPLRRIGEGFAAHTRRRSQARSHRLDPWCSPESAFPPRGKVFCRPGWHNSPMSTLPKPSDDTLTRLSRADYVAERSLATTVFLALKMSRPLFLEGEAGVGKTEVATGLAGGLGRTLVRLQCYEGLDIASAVYEWNYSRQMIEIRLAETEGASRDAVDKHILSDRFRLQR